MIATYAEFWPFYLREHSRPSTRSIHFLGTGMALFASAPGARRVSSGFFPRRLPRATRPPGSRIFYVEKNRPATFTYPLWSLTSDFKMAFLWNGGRLSGELERAGVLGPGR